MPLFQNSVVTKYLQAQNRAKVANLIRIIEEVYIFAGLNRSYVSIN
jgi:hypothetical protein